MNVGCHCDDEIKQIQLNEILRVGKCNFQQIYMNVDVVHRAHSKLNADIGYFDPIREINTI